MSDTTVADVLKEHEHVVSSISNLVSQVMKPSGKRRSSISNGNKGCAEKCDNSKVLPTKIICQQWIKTSEFTGEPKYNNFRQRLEEIPTDLPEGNILIKALYWTVDHYMRAYNIPLGSVMIGDQVGCVMSSKNPDYPVDSIVVCNKGWRTISMVNPSTQPVIKMPRCLGNLPFSLSLDVLGFPGVLAYYTLHHVCPVHAKEIIVINAAAGPVANILGQMAKMKDCIVIGFCGSVEKSAWLRAIGFDHVFHYSIVRPSCALKVIAPKGIDVFFDFVGKEFMMDAVSCVKPEGVTCVFGQDSIYNNSTLTGHKPDPYHIIVMKDKQIEHHSLLNHQDIFPQAVRQLLTWIQEGKIQYKQELFQGFETLPHALKCLYDNSLVGKLIILSTPVTTLKESKKSDVEHVDDEQ